MNRTDIRKSFAASLIQAERNFGGNLKGTTSTLAILIETAMNDLIDMECPNCLRPLDPPSLEDIQEWLKEEK